MAAKEQDILVMEAALEVLQLLAKGWRHQDSKAKTAMANCPMCAYSPDVISYYVRHWTELQAAANGMGSATSDNPIALMQSEDPDARKRIVATKADLESATDQALAPMLCWQATARIYKRQTRFNRYLDLRMKAPRAPNPPPEPSLQPLAEAICTEAISRHLGWRPHDVCIEEP